MRWMPVIWFLVSITIFASTVEAKRAKRDLDTIKKFLISSFLGSSRKKCAGRSSHRGPSQSYDFFIVPDRQRFVTEPEGERTNLKEVETAEGSNENFLWNSIRHLLASGVIHETSQVLKGLISTLQQDATNEETDSGIEVNLQDQKQYGSGDTFQINQNLLPIMHAPERILSYELDYGRQQIQSVSPLIARFVSPIISMPRKYSYEQAKEDTIETFTLDKNSNVIVTETRNPLLPRPVYINNRIKEVILSAPSTLKVDNKNYASALVKSKPYNEGIANGNILNVQINSLRRPPVIYQDNLQAKTMTQTFRKDAENPVSISEAAVRNGMLQQHLNLFHKLANLNTTSLRQNQLHDIPTRILDDTAPSVKGQVGFNETLDKEKDTSNDAARSIQTRYTYKQETNTGLYHYDKTANVSVGREGNNIVLKMVPNDNVADYTGKPIIVGSLDNTEEMIDNLISTSDSEFIGQQKNNAKPRGDIPE